MTLADGTYKYRLPQPYGPGLDIKATVRGGKVINWQRNGLSAPADEYSKVDHTELLAAEIAERTRLAGLLKPVAFTPAAQEGTVAA